MLKRLQLLLLLPILAGSASAEDVSLIVNKNFKQEIHVGGLFGLFHKDEHTKQTWLEMRPKDGTVSIKSVSLNADACSFEHVDFPVSVSSTKTLDVFPNCNVAQAEVKTDRGTYRFNFN